MGRSERWHHAGLCSGCGVEGPLIEVGGRKFCEACAPAVRRNHEVGGQFFAFMGAVLVIGLCALLLSAEGEASDEIAILRIKVGLAALFFGLIAWWVRRGLRGRRNNV